MRNVYPRPLDKIVEMLLIQRLLIPVLAAMLIVVGATGFLVWQSLTTRQAAQAQSLAMRVEDYLSTASQILAAAGDISAALAEVHVYGCPAGRVPVYPSLKAALERLGVRSGRARR